MVCNYNFLIGLAFCYGLLNVSQIPVMKGVVAGGSNGGVSVLDEYEVAHSFFEFEPVAAWDVRPKSGQYEISIIDSETLILANNNIRA